MKRYFILLTLVILSGVWLLMAVVQGKGEQLQQVRDVQTGRTYKGALRPDIDFGKIPLYFVANQGQVNKKALFYAKASRYTLWLNKGGLVFDSFKKVKVETTHPAPSGHPSQEGSNDILCSPDSKKGMDIHASMQSCNHASMRYRPQSPHLPHLPHSTKIHRDVSRLIFLDANKNTEMVLVTETELRVNYFKGRDKSQWHCDIPTSQAVLYKSLYNNIDLKVYGIEKEIEYDWMVKPGGNPGDIRFVYKNVKGTRLDEAGNLLIETDFGELIHKKPVSYQETRMAQSEKRMAQGNYVGAGLRACPKECNTQNPGVGAGSQTCPPERKDVNVTFKKIAENTYGFEVGEYDNSRELIIDPVVLAYSTYLGGSEMDWGYGIAVDGSGCAYVTGYTRSLDFPTLDGYQPDLDEYCDVFITKLDTAGSGASSLIYSAYLGGDGSEAGFGIAVDDSGCVYVAGETVSSNFPILNQYQGEYSGGWDVFLTKLDTTKKGASGLVYSTYLGGSSDDFGRGLAVDSSGCGYVTGCTESSNFPILDQYQAYQGDEDVFLTKIDTTKSGASSLVYSTYLGSSDYDFGYGVAVDSSGCAYVTGCTDGSDFPILNQYQAYQGGNNSDAFVTKLDTNKNGASSLVYSTYLGGSNDDEGWDIAVDSKGCAYVTGYSRGPGFPILNQYQGEFSGGLDAFLTKLDTAKSGASSLIYSTYLGGNAYDMGSGIAVDDSGCAYITGDTWSPDFPTLNEFQAEKRGHYDAFVTKVDTTQSGASSLVYSTYLGGSDNDNPRRIAVDSSGGAYVTGDVSSTDFPTMNQYQGYQGIQDTFITRLVYCTETPSIQLNRDTLYFGAVSGSSQTGSQTFSVSISGGCNMSWTASGDENWIQVTPTKGTGSAVVTVSVDTGDLAIGTYTGAIFIIYGSASQSVSLNLTIYDDVSTSVPFGEFSTPLHASVARGSIPVTGWVLDDIGVESVKIYRDNNIYVGDAVFVDGARPDVEAAFPDYPFNYRAGWGYMLLTNFFPNSGNGTYTLHAVATDVEGNSVTLGTKTIICDNANAVKPFGTIDTPTQGGMASGSGYINWGWVLTPQPNHISTDGSTIHVWVDGVNIGSPVYNIFRSDIAAFFPGYANSDGAAGYFSLDTTAYANGVHTIQWTVTDSAGNTDGIGSRYFTIQNSSSASRVSNVQRSLFSDQHLLPNIEPRQLPIDDSNPITVKKGWGGNMETQQVYPEKNGIVTVETRELQRVVIFLDGEPSPGEDTDISTQVRSSHVGPDDSYVYLMAGDGLRPLPIGSTFDAKRDIFYWQPGPAFIGQYNFLFIKKGLDAKWQKKIIRVVIKPGS